MWEPRRETVIGHVTPGVSLQQKSQNQEPGEGRGEGEGCCSRDLSTHIMYRPRWACPHCSPQVHSEDTSFSIFP